MYIPCSPPINFVTKRTFQDISFYLFILKLSFIIILNEISQSDVSGNLTVVHINL